MPILSGTFRWEASKVVTNDQMTVASELEDVGIATVHAKYPAMAVLERRSESFLPMSYDHPKGAEELAAAGYFFNGNVPLPLCGKRLILCLRYLLTVLCHVFLTFSWLILAVCHFFSF